MSQSWLSALLVFLGGGTGAVLRHVVNASVTRGFGSGLPWGIFTINVTGSICMGLVTGWLAFKSGPFWTQNVRLLLTTGVLGGYTTFSAFSLDAALLWQRGEPGMALLYVAGSVGFSIFGLFLGLALMRTFA